MKTIEFRGRCPNCNTERAVFGPRPASTPAQLDALEAEIDRCGGAFARCPTCDSTEMIATFVDGVQVEPWVDADQFERQSGPAAGPLRPKPWGGLHDGN